VTTKLEEIRAAVAEFHPKLEELPEWEAQIYTIKFAVVSCIWLTDLLAIAEAAEAMRAEIKNIPQTVMTHHMYDVVADYDKAAAKVKGEADSKPD
jgi:hypothetical protein